MPRRADPLAYYAEVGGKPLLDAIKTCEEITAQYDAQYLTPAPAAENWTTPGAVTDYTITERGARIRCERGWLELEWLTPDCLRVTLLSTPGVPSPAIARQQWPTVPVEAADSANEITLTTPVCRCVIERIPFRLRLELLDGRLICADTSGIAWANKALRLSMALQPDEGCYGLGLRASKLNLRGRRLALWNVDPGIYNRDSDPLSCSIPFYLGVHNQGAYGVLWDNPLRGSVDLGAARADELVFEAEGGALRYYLFAATDSRAVIAAYTELTGRAELPPQWALGFQQAAHHYDGWNTLLEIAQEFRRRDIPCEAIYLDGFQAAAAWNEYQLPELRRVMAELQSQNFKVIAPLTPGVPVNTWSGSENAIFLKYPDGVPAVGASWLGMCQFPDFDSLEAREWWRQRLTPLINLGIDGIANDMSEPASLTRAGTLPDYAAGEVRRHSQTHNLYGLHMANTTLEVLSERPLRPFNLGRAGFAGAGRVMGTWVSNSSATWDHLRMSISQVLNLSLSGIAMVGTDAGGFFETPEADLYTRWLQAASLMPLCRASGFSEPNTPWAFGQPYELINRLTLQLRRRLMPFLYSQFALYREYGWMVVQPLFMLDPSLRDVDDSFLIGSSLLVAPVLEKGAISRPVTLPEGVWYDFWSNELIIGGQTITVTAPLERLPLFVRAGVVLPLLSEADGERLILRAYPGQGESVLYEDAGEGRAWSTGDYRWVYLTCRHDESGALMLNRRVAGHYMPLYKNIHVEIVGLGHEPYDVYLDRQVAPLWFYEDDVLDITTDDKFQQVEVIYRVSPDDPTHRRPKRWR